MTVPLTSRILLIVVNDAEFFLSHRLNIAQAARAQGYDVHIVTPQGPGVSQIQQLGFTFDSIPLTRWGGNPLVELKSIYCLIQLYRRLKPTVVHHVTIKPVIYGSIAARVAKVPALVNAISGMGQVFSAQGIKAQIRRRVVEGMYRFALNHPNQRVIFQNPDDRAGFLEKRLVRSQDTILLPGAGVDLEKFRPSQKPQSPALVLFASRLLKEKGVAEFVAAAKVLKDQALSARFVVVGNPIAGNPGSVSADDIQRWEKLGVVEFWGQRSDMAEIFNQASIVCLPSYYREGIPKVLIEAAASGLAIVTTDWPGCREIVRHQINGLLVPTRDVPALADALRQLILDRQLCCQLGQRGREIVSQEGFGEKEVVERTIELYQVLERNCSTESRNSEAVSRAA